MWPDTQHIVHYSRPLSHSLTSQMRPTTGPMRKDGVKPKHAIFRKSSQPPKGMHINHDDLVGLATGPPGQGEAVLKSHDREIVSYKRHVQNNKQMLSSLRRRARTAEVEPYRYVEILTNLVSMTLFCSEYQSQPIGLTHDGRTRNSSLLSKVKTDIVEILMSKFEYFRN